MLAAALPLNNLPGLSLPRVRPGQGPGAALCGTKENTNMAAAHSWPPHPPCNPPGILGDLALNTITLRDGGLPSYKSLPAIQSQDLLHEDSQRFHQGKAFGGGCLRENSKYQKNTRAGHPSNAGLTTVVTKVIMDHHHFQHLVEPKLLGSWPKANHANHTNKSYFQHPPTCTILCMFTHTILPRFS